jgi:hypothetical protein
MMQTRLRTAVILLTVAALAGVWLVLAPFVVDYQPTGTTWTTATITHVALGTLLTLAGATAALTTLGTALQHFGAQVGPSADPPQTPEE